MKLGPIHKFERFPTPALYLNRGWSGRLNPRMTLRLATILPLPRERAGVRGNRCQPCRIIAPLPWFMCGLLLVGVAGLPLPARAQAPVDTNEIPKLRPPHPEIPPGFWAQHGTVVLILGLVLAALAGLIVWWLTRPKAVIVVPPEAEARAALAGLPVTADEGVKLSRISQILRHYVQRAFELPPNELTTTEFCRALADHPHLGPELAGALGGFLRDTDRRKFAPAGATPPQPEAVAAALALIDQCEVRRAAQRAAAAADPGNHPA